MPNHEDKNKCYLISIEASNRDSLFDCYRDYLVFMSLVRDGVRSRQYKVFGFCWLKKRSLMIIQPENDLLGSALLRLLKRYHFWLLQAGSATTEFKLQILQLNETSCTLDSLRYLHQQAVHEKVVEDAMDYHWHSHHVYNGFWSVNWLDTGYILDKFAGNRLVAMNRFRQYMLHGHRLNFTRMLELDDCSKSIIKDAEKSSHILKRRSVAEVNSHYHQSLLERTHISLLSSATGQIIKISVLERNFLIDDNKQAVN